jgi:hypothetical protein
MKTKNIFNDVKWKGSVTMKKLLTIMFILFVLVLTGCGSDKFSGKWINTDAAPGKSLVELEISKNGNGYVIIRHDLYYEKGIVFANEKEVERIRKENHDLYMNNLFQKKPQMKEEPVSIYDYTFTWKNDDGQKLTGTAKDNSIQVDNTMGLVQATFIEKDGTLLFDSRTYRKEKDNEINGLKKAEQDRLQNELSSMKVLPGTKVGKVKFVDSSKKIK